MPLPFLSLIRRCLVVVLFAVAAVPAGAGDRIKGSGVSRTETRSVSGFHAVALGITADVEVRPAATATVTITGDDNIVPLVETVVEDGTLQIRWANRRTEASYRNLRLVVEAPQVDALSVAGSGSIQAASLKGEAFRAALSGSGRIAVDGLEVASVALKLAGSGVVKLAGRTDTLEATLAGSGDLAAANLQSRTVRVAMSGSGRADVRASERLDAKVTGSGLVVYRGKPKVNRTVLGSGAVRAGKE